MCKNIIYRVASFATIIALVVGVSIVHVELVHAAALSSLSDTQSSVQKSSLSDHTIQFVTPTGISAAQSISITFPSTYATGTFAIANFDLATSTSATCSGFTDAAIQSGAASGLTWGVSQATATIYITSGTATIPANRCVQIEIGSNATSSGTGVSQITNPTSAGVYSISLIAGADSGSINVTILDSDQVAVTGTVTQSLTFTISTTTIYFGNLSSLAVKYASSTNASGDTTETVAHTLAVSTNASAGFTLTVRGQTLTSQQNSANTISAIGATAASSTAASEQFAIRATEAGGTNVTVDPTFSAATSYGYDATATTSAIFATATGPTLTSTLSLRYIANISAITEAGTYAATLNYVATANF